jgi:hypothetical protein
MLRNIRVTIGYFVDDMEVIERSALVSINDAEYVFLNYFKNLNFFMYKTEICTFIITEEKTGSKLCEGYSKEDAIEKANDILSKKSDKDMYDSIEKITLKHGLAN